MVIIKDDFPIWEVHNKKKMLYATKKQWNGFDIWMGPENTSDKLTDTITLIYK